MALTKKDLELIGKLIDERQGKHVLPLINRILDMMVTKEDAKNFVTKEDAKHFATKDDLKHFMTKDDANELERRLRSEANENYLSLKADIDEVIGLLGANVQDLTPKKEFRGLEVRVVKLEEVVGLRKH